MPWCITKSPVVRSFVAVCLVLLFSASSSGEEPEIAFDVPALVGVRVIDVDGAHVGSNSQKTIEVVIPVSTESRSGDRDSVQEFRFDVFWNRNIYPICDYGPKTQTVSDIEGLISVDKSSEKNSALGIKVGSSYQDVVSGSGTAEISSRNGTKLHYQEIPQHELLVASGTIHRGTGAFFRFHPSRTESLEGGRDLVVAFQVPQSWRAGVLQVECQAKGSRKVLAWHDDFEVSRAFILPIYLEGDDQARQAATEFVRSEQRLRKNWQRHRQQPERESLAQFQSIFGPSPRSNSASRIPTNWVHYLIQSSDAYLEKYQTKLPTNVAVAAKQFVQARADLLKLSR